MPDFDLLLEFVQQRCKVLENIQGPVRVERAVKNVATGKTSKSFMSTTQDKSVHKKQFKCAFCNEGHSISWLFSTLPSKNVEILYLLTNYVFRAWVRGTW